MNTQSLEGEKNGTRGVGGWGLDNGGLLLVYLLVYFSRD